MSRTIVKTFLRPKGMGKIKCYFPCALLWESEQLNVLGKNQVNKTGRKKDKESDRSNIIEDLKRGGVKVIGKGGELQDIGKQKKGQRRTGDLIGSNLKL